MLDAICLRPPMFFFARDFSLHLACGAAAHYLVSKPLHTARYSIAQRRYAPPRSASREHRATLVDFFRRRVRYAGALMVVIIYRITIISMPCHARESAVLLRACQRAMRVPQFFFCFLSRFLLSSFYLVGRQVVVVVLVRPRLSGFACSVAWKGMF